MAPADTSSTDSGRARSVYEYGESISLGTAVFDDYVRIAAGATTAPTAVQLLDVE